MSSPRTVSRVSPVRIHAGRAAPTRLERASPSRPSLGVPRCLVTATVTKYGPTPPSFPSWPLPKVGPAAGAPV
jgi:hypothetical protein